MQKAVSLFLPAMFGLLLTGTAVSQSRIFATPSPTPTPKPSPTPDTRVMACPRVSVQHQGGQQIRDGQPVSFTVNIAGGDSRVSPTIIWNVSAGFVSKGENSPSITVDSTGAGSTPEREIKADVWVGGYAPECVLQASSTVKVIGPAAKFGEFGEIDDEKLKINLKALADFLSQSPDNLWLIVYAGRNSQRSFAASWSKRIKDELIANAVSTRRIMVVDGGFREQPLFDFWIVPLGAQPPRATPTIDRREIVYPRSVPAKKP
jgi:hypothetical protein